MVNKGSTEDKFRNKLNGGDLKEASYYSKKAIQYKKEQALRVKNDINYIIDYEAKHGKTKKLFYKYYETQLISATTGYFEYYKYISSNEDEFKKLGFGIEYSKDDLGRYVAIYW